MAWPTARMPRDGTVEVAFVRLGYDGCPIQPHTRIAVPAFNFWPKLVHNGDGFAVAYIAGIGNRWEHHLLVLDAQGALVAGPLRFNVPGILTFYRLDAAAAGQEFAVLSVNGAGLAFALFGPDGRVAREPAQLVTNGADVDNNVYATSGVAWDGEALAGVFSARAADRWDEVYFMRWRLDGTFVTPPIRLAIGAVRDDAVGPTNELVWTGRYFMTTYADQRGGGSSVMAVDPNDPAHPLLHPHAFPFSAEFEARGGAAVPIYGNTFDIAGANLIRVSPTGAVIARRDDTPGTVVGYANAGQPGYPYGYAFWDGWFAYVGCPMEE